MATKVAVPDGWYATATLRGQIAHRFAGGRCLCGSPAKPGEPWHAQHSYEPATCPVCEECKDAHAAAWAGEVLS